MPPKYERRRKVSIPEDAATIGIPPISCPRWPERVAGLLEFLRGAPHRKWREMTRWARSAHLTTTLLRHQLAYLEMSGQAECVAVVRGECVWKGKGGVHEVEA